MRSQPRDSGRLVGKPEVMMRSRIKPPRLGHKPVITTILMATPFLAAAQSAEAWMNAGSEALLIGNALKKSGTA